MSYFYPPKTAILTILKKEIQRDASSEFKAQLLRISNATKYNSPFCKSYFSVIQNFFTIFTLV